MKLPLHSHCFRIGRLVALIGIAPVILGGANAPVGESHYGPSWPVVITGSGNGGTLTVSCGTNLKPATAYIQTMEGEDASSIARRISETLGAHAFAVRDGLLRFDTGLVALGGDTQPYSVPEAPYFLTARHRPERGLTEIYWEYPDAPQYDQLLVVPGDSLGTNLAPPFEPQLGLRADPIPEMEAGIYRNVFQIHLSPERRSKLPLFWHRRIVVIGRAGKTQSNVAHLFLSAPWRQEELADYPFTAGLAPNWRGWTAPGSDAIVYREGRRPVPDLTNLEGVSGPYEMRERFQILAGPANSLANGGIYRKFLALDPARLYRVRVRVNTLCSQLSDAAWTFTVSMYVDGESGRRLSGEEVALLGSTKRIPEDCAFQTAVFGSSEENTAGEWRELLQLIDTSDLRTGRSRFESEVDIIVVLELKSDTRGCTYGAVGVGMDWIALEDLTLAEEMDPALLPAGGRLLEMLP